MSVNQKKVTCILLFLSLVSCRKDPNNSIVYDVVLVVGQSNTYYGDGLDVLVPYIESESIKQLGRHGDLNYKIVPATEPLENDSKPSNKGGYVLTFANLYTKSVLDKNHKLLLIPCAKAGSGFMNNDWNQGGKLYKDAVERTNYILSHFRGSKLSAILWHQGESDVDNQNYETDLDSFIVNIRKDLNAEQTPFLLGGMVPYWVKQTPKRIAIQKIIKNTPNRISNTKYSDPEFLLLLKRKTI